MDEFKDLTKLSVEDLLERKLQIEKAMKSFKLAEGIPLDMTNTKPALRPEDRINCFVTSRISNGFLITLTAAIDTATGGDKCRYVLTLDGLPAKLEEWELERKAKEDAKKEAVMKLPSLGSFYQSPVKDESEDDDYQ